MKLINIKYTDIFTLKDLREFVDKCKNIPEDTCVVINSDADNESTNIVQVQADNDSIIFYNW